MVALESLSLPLLFTQFNASPTLVSSILSARCISMSPFRILRAGGVTSDRGAELSVKDRAVFVPGPLVR